MLDLVASRIALRQVLFYSRLSRCTKQEGKTSDFIMFSRSLSAKNHANLFADKFSHLFLVLQVCLKISVLF